MNIIKLDAIDSTSVFLKDLSRNNELENFTTVTANTQFMGKGQMDTKWHSEGGKNLLFTVYANLKGLHIDYQPLVSFLVAIKLKETLMFYLQGKTKLTIKWPNDIMSYNDKLAGILVENIIKKGTLSSTFIGIGLNVNQLKFPDFLPQATSMGIITGMEYDKDLILELLLNKIKEVLNVAYLLKNEEKIKKDYISFLYKLKTPSMFKDKNEEVFMGKIVNVSSSGLLEIEKEDESIYAYAVKEVRFL